MDGTTSGPGGSGAGGGSAPAGAVDVPAAQQNVTQVVITTGTLWRGVGVVLGTVAGLWAVNQARGLTSMLVISLFFALALVPGVNHLHEKRGWRRGAAVGFIYLAGILVLVLLTLVLIPAIAQLAEQVGQNGTQWLTSLDRWTSDTFGIHIVGAQASRDAAVTVKELLTQWSDKLIGTASGVVSTGVGFVFNVATIATFTFYFAADFPQLLREFLSWFSPARQQRLGWTIDQSITQVGGYLYSRLLLSRRDRAVHSEVEAAEIAEHGRERRATPAGIESLGRALGRRLRQLPYEVAVATTWRPSRRARRQASCGRARSGMRSRAS